VFCGIDVGKGEHHAVGLDPAGTRLFDKALPNDEPRLRAVFDRLAVHGPVLVIVDQPNTVGALPVTVARACGHAVAYLPGRRCAASPTSIPARPRPMREMRSSSPIPLGRCRTRCVGSMSVTKRWPSSACSSGSTTTLPGKPPASLGRIRGLLTGIHPALERVLGPKITHPAVLEILSRCGGPVGIRKAGKRRLTTLATTHAPPMDARLAEEILAALDAQTVTVPGSNAAEIVLPKLADSLKEILQQRKNIADDVERMLDNHPLSQAGDVDARRRHQNHNSHPARDR